MPRHGSEIQEVKLVSKDLFTTILIISRDWDISSKEIHILLVHARGVISDFAWDIVASNSLNLSPSEVRLDWLASWTVQLIGLELL